jgi:hypothetical protein
MDTNLTPEQSQALGTTGEEPLTIVDPATNRKYVLVAADDFSKLETVAAIRSGLSQMEAGEGQELNEAFRDIRSQFDRDNS